MTMPRAWGGPELDPLMQIRVIEALAIFFGAIPADERVVSDGNMVCAAGVTAGIDCALRVAADLRGAEVAQAIQLS